MNSATRYKIRGFALIAMLAICGNVTAQRSGFFNSNATNLYTSAGIGGGSAHYIGDLTPLRQIYYIPYTNVRWNGTAHYTKYLNENFGARVSFTWARLYGDDFTFAKRNFEQMYQNYVRNLHFRNDVQEFAISGIWNLRKQYGNNNQLREKFTPYVSAGLGVIGHNPKAIQSATINPITVFDKWIPLKQYNTAGQGLPGLDKKPYSLLVPVIPLAVGFRLRVTKNLDLGFEAGYRVTLSDYIDDVSNDNYPNQSDLANAYGAAAANFSYRADENYHAISGASRIADFIQAFGLAGGPTIAGITPLANATSIYNPDNPSVLRGSGSTIFHRFDQYIMTQVTLSFVLSSQVKCPPVK